MKAFKRVFFTVLALFCITGTALTVHAYFGEINDSLVDMIYWSQGGGSNMYWTGVTNKVRYDKFKPCVGPSGSEYACGGIAGYSEYKEYGRWLSSGVGIVSHGLSTESGSFTGKLQYQVDVVVQPSDR